MSKAQALLRSESKDESVRFFMQYRQEEYTIIDKNSGERKERMRYLWNVIRDFLGTRVFYKRNCKKSARKELDVLTKLKETKLLNWLMKGQENLVFQRSYEDSTSKKQVEFVVLNRLMPYEFKFDYIFNFDTILKPSIYSE